jgi:hypothetical protein
LIQEIIVAYSLYKITKDPLTLGLIGLAEAIPFISCHYGAAILQINLINNHYENLSILFIPLPLVLWGLFHLYGLNQISVHVLSLGIYAVIFVLV